MTVRRYLGEQLDKLADWLLGNAPERVRTITFEQPAESGLSLDIDGREVRVDATVRHAARLGSQHRAVTNDIAWREWVIPLRPDHSAPQETIVDGTVVFSSPAHAFTRWSRALRTLFIDAHAPFTPRELEGLRAETTAWVERIETSGYPKHPGDHCRHCPVLHDCFGVEAG